MIVFDLISRSPQPALQRRPRKFQLSPLPGLLLVRPRLARRGSLRRPQPWNLPMPLLFLRPRVQRDLLPTSPRGSQPRLRPRARPDLPLTSPRRSQLLFRPRARLHLLLIRLLMNQLSTPLLPPPISQQGAPLTYLPKSQRLSPLPPHPAGQQEGLLTCLRTDPPLSLLLIHPRDRRGLLPTNQRVDPLHRDLPEIQQELQPPNQRARRMAISTFATPLT